MTKKLKIAIPPIRCYQHYAFPVSIINSNIQQKEYLYSLFIKLVYRRNRDTDIEFDTPRFFSHIPTFFAEKGLIIPSVTKYHLNADDKESMISFVKQLINNGIYVSGMWNENYIPGKDAYNKYNYKRNYLIYGYNEEKRCLISAGYLGKNFGAMNLMLIIVILLPHYMRERKQYAFSLTYIMMRLIQHWI